MDNTIAPGNRHTSSTRMDTVTETDHLSPLQVDPINCTQPDEVIYRICVPHLLRIVGKGQRDDFMRTISFPNEWKSDMKQYLSPTNSRLVTVLIMGSPISTPRTTTCRAPEVNEGAGMHPPHGIYM